MPKPAYSQLIERDETALRIRIAQSGLAILALCIVTTVLFQTALGFQTRAERLVLTALWLTLPVTWAIGSAAAWITRNKLQYYLLPKAVMISKAGFVGRHEQMYRYDSILSVGVRKGWYGKQYGYGDIVLTIPKLAHGLVLRDVKNPQAWAQVIKERAGRTGSDSLIH